MAKTSIYAIFGGVLTFIGLIWLVISSMAHASSQTPDGAQGSNDVPLLLFIILGATFTFLGVVLLALAFREARRTSRIMREGIPIRGQVVSVELNRQVRINEEHPWQVTAIGRDPSGMEREFTQSFSGHRPPLEPGQTIEILIDPRSPRHFRFNMTGVGPFYQN